MVYPNNFVQVTIEGVFGTVNSPYDIWRTGFKVDAQSGQFDPASLSAFLVNIQSDITAFHTDPICGSGNLSVITALSAALIGPDGRYVGGDTQETTRLDFASDAIVGAGSSTKALSSACVLTLRSALARGRASVGRMFWPALALPLTGSGQQVLGSTAQAISLNAATMLNSINATAINEFGTGIAQVTNLSRLGTGVKAPVVRIEVGTRIDMQLRRSNSLPEVYHGTDLENAEFERGQQAYRVAAFFADL